jgi:hypothetical protein
MKNRRALRPALIATASLLALGLSCIVPGKYRIYRVANSKTASSPGCYPDGIPEDVAQDTTTFKTGQTFAVYAAGSGTFFLEMVYVGDGEFYTIEGTRSGREYTFEGTTVDVQPSSEPPVTVTETFTVDLMIKGRKVEGTFTYDRRSTDGEMCTRTTDFVGAEVKDVDLEHPV